MSESIRRNAFSLSAAHPGMSTILGARLQIRWSPTAARALLQRHSRRAGEYSQAIERELERICLELSMAVLTCAFPVSRL